MASPDAIDKDHQPNRSPSSEGEMSSEKREDIWAVIVAMATLIVCVAFPEQVHDFFSKALYLF
jgi:hypothetical protein